MELCAFLVVKMIVYGIVCDQSFIMIVGEIVCTLSSLQCLPVELCARLVPYSDCRLNCVRVY